MIEADSEEGG